MKIIFLMVLSIFLLRADETLTELFQQLSKTPKAQKYKVLNEIKTHIVQLKTEKRVDAIKALQKEKKSQKEVDKTSTAEQVEDNIQKSTEEMPMKMSSDMENMSSDMSNMQNMSNMSNMSNMQNMSNIQNMFNIPIRQERQDQRNMEIPMTSTPSQPNPSSRNNMSNGKR